MTGCFGNFEDSFPKQHERYEEYHSSSSALAVENL